MRYKSQRLSEYEEMIRSDRWKQRWKTTVTMRGCKSQMNWFFIIYLFCFWEILRDIFKKTIEKLGIEGNFLEMRKGIYENGMVKDWMLSP